MKRIHPHSCVVNVRFLNDQFSKRVFVCPIRRTLTQSKLSELSIEITVIKSPVLFRDTDPNSHVQESRQPTNLGPFPVCSNRAGSEKFKRRETRRGRSFMGRYSKMFSALFSDGDSSRER